MSDTEPNDTVNAGMAIQIEGRRLVPSSKSTHSDFWLVGVRLQIGFNWRRKGSVRKGGEGTC